MSIFFLGIAHKPVITGIMCFVVNGAGFAANVELGKDLVFWVSFISYYIQC